MNKCGSKTVNLSHVKKILFIISSPLQNNKKQISLSRFQDLSSASGNMSIKLSFTLTKYHHSRVESTILTKRYLLMMNLVFCHLLHARDSRRWKRWTKYWSWKILIRFKSVQLLRALFFARNKMFKIKLIWELLHWSKS